MSQKAEASSAEGDQAELASFCVIPGEFTQDRPPNNPMVVDVEHAR
jgi:hypothetical protein